MISLFEDISLYDCIFELFLKDKIFLFEGFESIEIASWDMLSKKHFTKSSTSESRNDIKTRETNFTIIGDLIKLIS